MNTDRQTLAAIARRAMIERGLEPDFPPAAQREASAMGRPADATGDVRDLRDRLWVSIDNDDSRDLDQLTVAEPLAAGRVRILVAVADVDALVRRDSAIDGHASHNTTSVYTPAAIFPMLPEALSTGLTSLNENEDRYSRGGRHRVRGRRLACRVGTLSRTRSKPRTTRIPERRGVAGWRRSRRRRECWQPLVSTTTSASRTVWRSGSRTCGTATARSVWKPARRKRSSTGTTSRIWTRIERTAPCN